MRTLRGLEMNTTVKKDWLLEKLKANRAEHAECYEEAKAGYLQKAQEKLDVAMQKLKDGKLVRLSFNLSVPGDHTAEYDTVIQMLEANVQFEVTLTAPEFRMLVEDQWEWMGDWLVSNSGYSHIARTKMEAMGL